MTMIKWQDRLMQIQFNCISSSQRTFLTTHRESIFLQFKYQQTKYHFRENKRHKIFNGFWLSSFYCFFSFEAREARKGLEGDGNMMLSPPYVNMRTETIRLICSNFSFKFAFSLHHNLQDFPLKIYVIYFFALWNVCKFSRSLNNFRIFLYQHFSFFTPARRAMKTLNKLFFAFTLFFKFSTLLFSPFSSTLFLSSAFSIA